MRLERLKPLYTARIPALAVTQDMLDALRAVAKTNDMSVSEIVRQAVSFFLSHYTSETASASAKTEGMSHDDE